MKNSILFICVLLILVGGAFFFWYEKAVAPTGDTTVLPQQNDFVRITTPVPQAIIKSPLAITGVARGTWFFEASFPVLLLDAKGNTIARSIGEAQGEWMTENFVPFTSTLTFSASSGPATLVFKKDNPSGLPEHDGEVRVPVVIQ